MKDLKKVLDIVLKYNKDSSTHIIDGYIYIVTSLSLISKEDLKTIKNEGFKKFKTKDFLEYEGFKIKI